MVPLRETVVTVAEKIEEAEVAEDLELLADFVADVGVFRMEPGEIVRVNINVGQREFGFIERAHDTQDIESPAAFFNFQRFEGAQPLIGAADGGRRQRLAAFDNRYARIPGDFVEQYVAPDPTGAAGRWGEGFAAFDGGKRKCKMGDKNNGAHGPLREVVMQDVEIWSAVFEDGALHLGVSGIDDCAPEDP